MPTKSEVKSTLLSVEDLRAMPVVPEIWIVDGLIRVGRKRPSLLAAKPETGKSCLARQIAVAVCKGIPVLGRQTMRSEVIYWASEDDPADTLDSWNRLGYDEATDEKLYTFNGDTTANHVSTLNEALRQHPKVRLVLVETLDALLKMDDIRGNTPARIAFDKFDQGVLAQYSPRVAFLCLTHLRKGDCDRSGDMILGATEIRGRTDAKIYLKCVSDEDDTRILHATVRKGVGIPPTYLNFHHFTETATLGMSVVEGKKIAMTKDKDAMLTSIVDFFKKNPKTTFDKDCLPAINGSTKEKWAVFKKACSDGVLVRSSGTGKKNSPRRFSVAETNPKLHSIVGFPEREAA